VVLARPQPVNPTGSSIVLAASLCPPSSPGAAASGIQLQWQSAATGWSVEAGGSAAGPFEMINTTIFQIGETFRACVPWNGSATRFFRVRN
jgi:hypothetical protein